MYFIINWTGKDGYERSEFYISEEAAYRRYRELCHRGMAKTEMIRH